MNICTEQVFLVNARELDQQIQHTPTTGQCAFAMPMAVTAIQTEAQTSMCLPQSMGLSSRTQMCRLCATVTEMVVPIFQGEGLQNNLAEKIHQHLPIQVSEKDVLPVVMCFQCTSTLLAWHELVVCSVQADTAMRERFNLTCTTHQQEQQPREQSTRNQIKDEKSGPHPATPVKREYHSDEFGLGVAEDKRELDTCDSNDSEERPLASFVEDKRVAFLTFYEALVRFRKHVAAEHAPHSHSHSHSSEESEGNTVPGDVGVEAFDDLSHRNRRRSRLDAVTRQELGAAQTRTPDGRLVYQCCTCSKQLSSAHTLIFHRRIHSGERPCVCHVCGAQFRTAPGLQRHLHETHERRRRLACPTCQRTFANAQNLKQHMRIHTGERPYHCTVCGKTFAQSGSLHAHGAVHRESRPHACAECGAAFRLRSGLARHRLRHTGERPHACGVCPRAFRSRHEAQAHRAAHSDARPHACDLCPAAFRVRRALRHHQRRLHHLDAPLPAHHQQLPLQVPLGDLAPPY